MATEVIDAGSSRETGGPRKRTPGPSPSGFNVSDATAKAVLSFVLAERRCCRRFRYGISFMPGMGTFSLTVDAPAGHLAAPLKALYSQLGQPPRSTRGPTAR